MPHADGAHLVLDCGERIGPFSSHWAACAAMIRLSDPSFVSVGGDSVVDLALEAQAMPPGGVATTDEISADLEAATRNLRAATEALRVAGLRSDRSLAAGEPKP